MFLQTKVTALHIAVQESNSSSVIEYLIKQGANVNSVNNVSYYCYAYIVCYYYTIHRNTLNENFSNYISVIIIIDEMMIDEIINLSYVNNNNNELTILLNCS